MFFSPDLLSKRDSGFGLLWLAATLGSKSAFKRLPKRSVLTADISQLCRLIATPAEPLALRLSSNLLVGAARVYRVKQEILVSDVTTCYNSLKRVEHEFRSMSSSDAQLHMAQPSARSSAVTLRADPKAALSVEFDAMVASWDEYLNLGVIDNGGTRDDSDDDYHSTVMKARGKATTASTLPPNSELLRATACTLSENHDFLLASSFDASFGETTKPSSSQIGGLGFDDTFDGLDIGLGIGDDLVRELGEGWGIGPIEENAVENFTQVPEDFLMNFETGDLDDGMTGHDESIQHVPRTQLHTLPNPGSHGRDSVGSPPSPSLPANKTNLPVDIAVQHAHTESILTKGLRKAKRGRPVLDVRTELTDEELKATRVYYLNRQNIIRVELEFKRFEKKQVDLIHGMLWDAPGSVHAKELVNFWIDRFKAHVEARSGLFANARDNSPCRKRRRLSVSPLRPRTEDMGDIPVPNIQKWRVNQDVVPLADGDNIIDLNYDLDANWGHVNDYSLNAQNLRSSEEPGQARHVSHPPPAFEHNLGIDVASDNFYSQRSALFPWDMAGGSSSVSTRGGIQPPSNDRISIDQADARLRGSSASRRGSSLSSLPGNLQAGVESLAMVPRMMQNDDDFIFDVPGDANTLEPRQTEANCVALEKNSYNFLEYAMMQYRSLPSTQYLVFDDIVPKATSTAHVAAAALYHCLVLATKDLLQVNQEEAYGQIEIRVV